MTTRRGSIRSRLVVVALALVSLLAAGCAPPPTETPTAVGPPAAPATPVPLASATPTHTVTPTTAATATVVAPTATPPPATATPAATATLPATATPEATATTAAEALQINIVSVSSPVSQGADATLVAHTAPGAQCDITVQYESGPSTAEGLVPKAADAEGNVSWAWRVGTRTTPGTWPITVTANKNGATATATTAFDVVG